MTALEMRGIHKQQLLPPYLISGSRTAATLGPAPELGSRKGLCNMTGGNGLLGEPDQ